MIIVHFNDHYIGSLPDFLCGARLFVSNIFMWRPYCWKYFARQFRNLWKQTFSWQALNCTEHGKTRPDYSSHKDSRSIFLMLRRFKFAYCEILLDDFNGRKETIEIIYFSQFLQSSRPIKLKRDEMRVETLIEIHIFISSSTMLVRPVWFTTLFLLGPLWV